MASNFKIDLVPFFNFDQIYEKKVCNLTRTWWRKRKYGSVFSEEKLMQ